MEQTPNNHWPLYATVIIAIVLGTIQAVYSMHGFHFHMWMDYAMGYYLVIMATTKFFNMPHFIMCYRQYDVLSTYIPMYACAYPYIELALGAMFINSIAPVFANILMALVMLSSLIGIIQVLRRGQRVGCGCMGETLKVELGTVSIVENVVMIAMAAMNLLMRAHH